MTENPVGHDDQLPPPPGGTPPQAAVPGPGLAQNLTAAAGQDGAGLAGLSDDQLIEMIASGRRMSSWSTWFELAAMVEYGTRHPAGKGEPGPLARGAADEIGFATRMTWTSAADRIAFGSALATRLPATLAALREGRIDPVHARIIEEYTAILSPEDAAEADEILAAAAAGLTPGQLRARAARVILRLDPDAARRRRESARRDASVRAYREDSGNAGISGRELPADEVFASFQNIEQRALDLRALGVEGSIRELKVLAMLDLLQERDSTLRLTTQDQATQDQATQDQATQDGPGTVPDPAGSDHDGRPHDMPHDSGAEDDGPADDEPYGSGDDGSGLPDDDGDDDGSGPAPGGGTGRGGPHGPAGTSGPGRAGGAGGTRLAAQVTIVVPWEAWLGQPSGPGEADGFGLIDPAQIQDLLTAAAADPGSRGCVTLLGPDGTAIAHGCGRGALPLPPAGTKQDEPDGKGPPGPPGNRKPAGPPTQATPAQDMIRRLKITLAPITRGQCDHRAQEPGRLPSRKLRHLIRARNTRCTAPGCGRPAIRCEQDHTIAWEDDGITCECNLGPLCKHHHIIKHLNHWLLEQPRPGTFTWHTPAGRTYTTQPTQY